MGNLCPAAHQHHPRRGEAGLASEEPRDQRGGHGAARDRRDVLSGLEVDCVSGRPWRCGAGAERPCSYDKLRTGPFDRFGARGRRAGPDTTSRSRDTAFCSRAAAGGHSRDGASRHAAGSDAACDTGSAGVCSRRDSGSLSRARSARCPWVTTGGSSTGSFDKLRTGTRRRGIDNSAAARRAAEPRGRRGPVLAGHWIVHVLAHLHPPDPPSSCA
jgi:hypothetical protein